MSAHVLRSSSNRTARRRALFGLLAGLVVVWGLVPGTSARVAQKGGEKTAFVAVVDNDGKPLKDLGKADFVVREDGADRPIADVKVATEPMQISLLVDSTAGTASSINDIRTGLVTFARTILGGSPDSSISVTSVSGSPSMLLDFKKSLPDVEKALLRVFPDKDGGGVMNETIADSGKRLAKATTPRREIVVLNLEGFPDMTQMQPSEVAKAVVAGGASLWAVSYRNTASTAASTAAGNDFHSGSGGAGGGIGANRDMILNNLTRQTGGARLTLTVASAIESSLKQVADVLLSQYAVTYSRPEGPTPKVVQMGVRQAGAHVLIAQQPPK